MFAAVLCGDNFTFNSTLSESWAYDDAVHFVNVSSDIVCGKFLAIDEFGLEFTVIVGGCL